MSPYKMDSTAAARVSPKSTTQILSTVQSALQQPSKQAQPQSRGGWNFQETSISQRKWDICYMHMADPARKLCGTFLVAPSHNQKGCSPCLATPWGKRGKIKY